MPASKYRIKKIFGPTLQGEGFMTGTPTMFIRMAGCNMWDGDPKTKAESKCPYCDTDFSGPDVKSLTISNILKRLSKLNIGYDIRWVTISGGEPMLQLDLPLLLGLSDAGWKICLETNGSIYIPNGFYRYLDHVAVSPKTPVIKVQKMDSLKILYPHPNSEMRPEAYAGYLGVENKYIQPIYGATEAETYANLLSAISKVYRLPGWRLSPQIHKIIGVE
jgi:organic radical activating enzyme